MIGSGVPTGHAGILPGIGTTGRVGGIVTIVGHLMHIAAISMCTTIIIPIVRSATHISTPRAIQQCVKLLQAVKTWHLDIRKAHSPAAMPAESAPRVEPSVVPATSRAEIMYRRAVHRQLQ